MTWQGREGGGNQRLRRSHAAFEEQKKSSWLKQEEERGECQENRIRKLRKSQATGDWGWDCSIIAGTSGRL